MAFKTQCCCQGRVESCQGMSHVFQVWDATRDEGAPEYLKNFLYITPMIAAMGGYATVPKSDDEWDCLCAGLPFCFSVCKLLLELCKLLFRWLSSSSWAALLPLWGLAAVLCLKGCKRLICARSAVAPACC